MIAYDYDRRFSLFHITAPFTLTLLEGIMARAASNEFGTEDSVVIIGD